MGNELIKPKSFKDLVQTDNVKNRLKEIIGDRSQQFAVALTQIVNGSYQLQRCEPTSILGAALTAASLDLSCDPNLGEAHLVPYGEKCQFQIGYRGFIQLAMRSGQYKAIGSAVVCEGELVSYDRLTGELVIDGSKKESDAVIGYAAKFKLINGFERAEYWTAEEIEKHAKRYSKAYGYAKGKPDKEKNCLWITDRDKMALKTVEKNLLSHYGPKSIQMQKALKVDGGAIVDVDTDEVSYLDNPATPEVSSPQFDEPKVPEPKDDAKPKAASKTSEKKPEGLNKLLAVKGLFAIQGLKDEDILFFVNDLQSEDYKSCDDIDDATIELLYEQHEDIINRIKEAK